MSRHTFLVQVSPRLQDIPPFSQPGFFFNSPEHLQQQDGGAFYLLSAVDTLTRQADARCAFFLHYDRAISPAAAPFGSVEYAADLPDSVLAGFLTMLEETVRKLAVTQLRLVHYPRQYAPKQTDRLLPVLLQHGFSVISANSCACLPIDSSRTTDYFAPAERRRLAKCIKAGFTFARWPNPNQTAVMHFILSTRRQQGYPLTIPPNKLRVLLQTFPAQFGVFTVHDGPRLIALTVTVRVRPDILYTFLPASDPTYRTFSPMVMLVDGLIGYCRQQQIGLLDLGLSLDANQQPKPSLLRFKRNLGAEESPKYILEKTF